MAEYPDALMPTRWLTIEELLQEFPHLRPEMGFYEGVSYHPAGERESREAAELREALEEVRDDSGRLVGLRPKGYRPSTLDVMRSVDLMMEMAR